MGPPKPERFYEPKSPKRIISPPRPEAVIKSNSFRRLHQHSPQRPQGGGGGGGGGQRRQEQTTTQQGGQEQEHRQKPTPTSPLIRRTIKKSPIARTPENFSFARTARASQKKEKERFDANDGEAGEQKQTKEKSLLSPRTEPRTPSSSSSVATPTNNNTSAASAASAASIGEPSLESVSTLIDDLATANDTSGEKPARALRVLFALSEDTSNGSEHRNFMVREADGQLVPVLLEFLRRCERGSSEQYLALLVLNNVSIPTENKRLIAVDCNGARALARMLCEDPSCHLIAIIIVNLSFADAELRRELVAPNSSIQLIDALCYALRVASLSPEEHNNRGPLVVGDSNGTHLPRKLLASAMAEDLKYRPTPPNGGEHAKIYGTTIFDSSNQLYPETARWCLCALKNLSRPSKDPLAAHALIETGIVPLILKICTPGGVAVSSESDGSNSNSSSTATPAPADPTGNKGSIENWSQSNKNDPLTWDSNSLQDAALFIILNLAFVPVARNFLLEERVIETLASITDVASSLDDDGDGKEHSPQKKQLMLQCLKARIALAALVVDSEGHFFGGKPRGKTNTPTDIDNKKSLLLLIHEWEVPVFIELLANTLHKRPKEGVGGYSAAAFTIKAALLAIRCILNNYRNQQRIANKHFFFVKLNALLFKVLAVYCLSKNPSIDAQAAEYACFSLYLLSNYGFKDTFLPAFFVLKLETNNKERNDHFLEQPTNLVARNILLSFSMMNNNGITEAGKHAAEQLLMRLIWLKFSGDFLTKNDTSSDFEIGSDILQGLASMNIKQQKTTGVKPLDDVMDRPILRCKPSLGMTMIQWKNNASVRLFPSALHAAQALSFGSTRIRHSGPIDDVLIANNIAKSANNSNSSNKTETYNYLWSWKDDVLELPTEQQFPLGSCNSMSSVNMLSETTRKSIQQNSEKEEVKKTFLHFLSCGNLCSLDTTTNP